MSFFVVAGTVEPIQVSPVELVDYLLGKTIYNGSVSKKIPTDIQKVARRKLRMLNNALTLQDVRIPPANHLEKLKGDRAHQYSIRINDQWRICFIFKVGNASDVGIVDYH